MVRLLLVLAAASLVFPQDRVLTPAAEFDLHAGLKLSRHARVRLTLSATPTGLTLVTIGENFAALTSADPNGRILHARSDLASVHAQIYGALPRPDGNVWLLSAGPNQAFGAYTELGNALPSRPVTGKFHSGPENYTDMDLYTPAGEHLEHLRLLRPVVPLAAGNDEIVLRVYPGQILYFGIAANGQFQKKTEVRLDPPVRFAFATMASNGEILLMDRQSGDMLIVDPKTHRGSVVHLPKPYPVTAVSTDADAVYLLTGDTVLKADLQGRILAEHRLQFGHGFQPVAIAVTGPSIYLVNQSGVTERFEL